MLYNPAQMQKEELYDTFVSREKLLSELLETIRENTGKKSIQHIILLGARGIGKTHMLRMVENKVSDSSQLRSKWVTVSVPEEQYGIFGLMDFFKYILEIIFHSSQLEKVDTDVFRKELEKVELSSKKEALDKLVSIFKDIYKKEKRQFLLLIDNVDKILAEKITEEKELEYLRSILMTEKFLMILGTSTSIFEEIALYDKAFFRFFKIIHLQNLNDKEVEELLLKRAKFDGIVDKIKLDENKNKIKAITDLTGGYPRLVLMLYEILEDKPLLDVLKTFNKLLDNLTPYYKHRMDDLTPQQQKIIDTIMLSDGVASPTDVAKKVGWKPTVVTSQFTRLKDVSILQVKEDGETKKKKSLYEISDKLFVIWYQMRYLGVLKRRIEYIVTFLKIWYDLGELKNKISVYASQYQQRYSTGNFSESYDYARSISIMSCAISETTEKEKICTEQFKRYFDIGKFGEALRDLNELLKIHGRNENKQGIAIDYGNMGNIYSRQGDLQKAIEYHEKALKIEEEIGNKLGMAKQLSNIGNDYKLQGDFQKALDNYEKSLKIFKEKCNKKGMANQLNHLGNIYRVQGNLLKALDDYEKAISIYEEIGDEQAMAIPLGNKGIIYELQGDLQKALNHYQKALIIHEEIGDRQGIANQLGNMGNAYRKQGDLQKALEYSEKGLKMHEEIGDRHGMASQLGNIGIVYMMQGDLQKALEYYKKAVKIDEEINNMEGMANELCNMGTVYRIQEDIQKALNHQEKALKISEAIRDKLSIAICCGNMGIIYEKQGDLQNAFKNYNASLKILKEIGTVLYYNAFMKVKINILLKFAITNNKDKNIGKAIENIKEIAESLKETKDEETITIINSALFELLIDSEYDFVMNILKILKTEHEDIFEICEPFLISAQYLKTKDLSILENTSSIVLEGVNKILKALEKQKIETS